MKYLKIAVIIILLLTISGCAKKQNVEPESIEINIIQQETTPILEEVVEENLDEEPNIYKVEIFDHEFVPETITIRQGDTITWEVVEGVHLLNDLQNNMIMSSRMSKGDTFNVVFDKPGKYKYHDQLRSFYGKIIVE